jgi:GTP diphosphokinase / guanosine-3',5'-bis(diphosphate) 3'-diphosphatase
MEGSDDHIYYEDEDNKLIQEQFEDLLRSCKKCQDEESQKLITKAFVLAKIAHKDQRRKTGKSIPFITHPIAVAKIVGSEIGFGTTAVVSALLHDVIEDTDYTKEDIQAIFGEIVASIVEGLTKITNVYDAEHNEQAGTFRKMLYTIPQDIRVIFIKVADRLHNMRTMDGMPEDRQIIKAGENLYVYVPLAYQLGLFDIKKELEDLSFKYRHPEEYARIDKLVKDNLETLLNRFNQFIPKIEDALLREQYNFVIKPIYKSYYTTWEKMNKRNISFNEVHNYLSTRIVFQPFDDFTERRQCMNIFAVITELFNVRKGSLQDWVKNPKSNGFEAIVFDVMGQHGGWSEIQVMSKRMAEIADKGYSELETSEESQRDKWIKRISEQLKDKDVSDSDEIEDIENFELGLSKIYIFTPKGKIIALPKGSTIIDFAFSIHTELGLHCIGAKVNNKLESVSYILNSTDQVEILDSINRKPDIKWLDFVVSQKAKTCLKSYFNKERKQLIEEGKHKLEEKLKDLSQYSLDDYLKRLVDGLQCKNEEDLFYKIACGIITDKELDNILKLKTLGILEFWVTKIFPKFGKSSSFQINEPVKFNAKEPYIIDETSAYSVAQCCKPIPGDDAIVYLNGENDLIVHKRNCSIAVKLNANFEKSTTRVIWRPHKSNSFLTNIHIKGIDRPKMILDITHVISEQLNVNMQGFNISANDGIFEGVINSYVFHVDDLNILISNLKKINGVEEVYRITSTYVPELEKSS